MTDLSAIRHIAFDADDTLWQNEDFYRNTQASFGQLLKPFIDPDETQKALDQTEARNMTLLGYGAKAMTMSLIETATQLVPDLPNSVVQQILVLGKNLLRMPTNLLPGAYETVTHCMRTRHVFIVTKGDLLEQERKFDQSPFKALGLDYIVLSGKEPSDYAKLLDRCGIRPDEFMMVGNSPRSDVLAPLEIGAYAVHVPYALTWSHEHTSLAPHPRMFVLKRIDELMALI